MFQEYDDGRPDETVQETQRKIREKNQQAFEDYMLDNRKRGERKTKVGMLEDGFVDFGGGMIHELRKKYDVDSDEGGYIITGPASLIVIDGNDEIREMYYSTDHWKDISNRRRKFDGDQCCWCHRERKELREIGIDLDVHHMKYDFFEEDIEDLMTLCRDCHENFHSAARSRRAFRWPQKMHPDLYDKIREEYLKRGDSSS